jgi:hypothetical protein
MDVNELVGAVAKRHRVVLSEDDPVLLTVTLNEVLLAEHVKRLAGIVEDAQRAATAANAEQLETARRLLAEAGTGAGARAADLIHAAGEAVAQELRAVIARTAAEAAVRHERVWRWALGSLTVTFLVLGATGAVAYLLGRARGLEFARDEQAAAAWANTPEGRLAYRLAQGGDLEALARCTAPGWHLENDVCFPRPGADGLHGWRTAGSRR